MSRCSIAMWARRCTLALVSCAICSAIPLSYPSPAQAGIFDFLFGRRRRGASTPTGRRSGGAVRDDCPINTADGDALDFASFQA